MKSLAETSGRYCHEYERRREISVSWRRGLSTTSYERPIQGLAYHRRARSAAGSISGGRMTENTLVSVVVAAFNAGPTLPRSIGTLLGQTHRNIEVVAVNDASTDDSARILAELAK